MLVGDIADDLFQNIFQRDQALDFAIFVDHQSEGRLTAAEGLELLRYRPGFGHEPGRRHKRHDVNLEASPSTA